MVHTASSVSPTRDRVLVHAARLFALRGFHGTSIDDLGAACGISGPAVYRHFANKDAVLAQLLIGISQQLRDDGHALVSATGDPHELLDALIEFHLDFTTQQPDLIRVQDRDLANLSADAARTVRSLQRAYVETWVKALCMVRPELTQSVARVEVHATFGLLNSTPHSGTGPASRERLALLARKALTAGR